MTKEDKENLKNKKLTDTLLFSCLNTCEKIISKNAYLERKWCHDWKDYGGYYATRLKWMEYRKKLRSLLLPGYQMKTIIQMTKSCTNEALQKEVVTVIGLIEKNDYSYCR